MSQHHEEKNLENILPLPLETIEEDDAKLDVEGEHLLLTITAELKTMFCSTMVVLNKPDLTTQGVKL